MPITVLLDPAEMPGRTQDQETFDNAVANVMQKLPTLGQQINATEAGMNSLAAGGAYAIQYKFGAAGLVGAANSAFAIKISDPSQSAATEVYFDKTSFGANVSALLAQFTASSSQAKGTIRVQKQGDTSKWVVYNVNSAVDYGTYLAFQVTSIAASATNPFTAGDAVMLFFQRTGDKGEPGNTGFAKFSDRRAQGTAADVSPGVGTITRTLNTVDANTFGATLASNAFTLPAGKYVVQARAPATGVNGNRAYLRNNTDNTTVAQGPNAFATAGTYSDTSDATVTAYLDISTAKSFSLRHYIGASGGTYLGQPVNAAGEQEIYSEVIVWKLQ